MGEVLDKYYRKAAIDHGVDRAKILFYQRFINHVKGIIENSDGKSSDYLIADLKWYFDDLTDAIDGSEKTRKKLIKEKVDENRKDN